MAYARFEGVTTTPTMTCAVAYTGWACGQRNVTTHLGLLDPSAEIPKQAGRMAYARFEGVAITLTMTYAVAYTRWACGQRNSTTHLGLLDPFAEIPKQAGGMVHARFEGVATTPTMTCAVTYDGWIRSSKEWWGSRTYVREAMNAYTHSSTGRAGCLDPVDQDGWACGGIGI